MARDVSWVSCTWTCANTHMKLTASQFGQPDTRPKVWISPTRPGEFIDDDYFQILLKLMITNVSFPCNGVQNLSTLEQGEEVEVGGELGVGAGTAEYDLR